MAKPTPSTESERMASGPPRAERFPIHISVRFRPPGEEEWLEGETENISRTGVLFRAPIPLDVNTPVELQFGLPVEVGGEHGAMVLSLGRIVRTILPADRDASPTMAAKLLDYRIVRGTESAA